jgi:hypothetical protein
MRRTFTTLAAAAALVAVTAVPALAQGKPAFEAPRDPAVECLKAGQDTLKSIGAFSAAARGEVNYALLDITGPGIDLDGDMVADVPGGLIGAELGDEAFLPLSTVFQLHLDAPGLFAWCNA